MYSSISIKEMFVYHYYEKVPSLNGPGYNFFFYSYLPEMMKDKQWVQNLSVNYTFQISLHITVMSIESYKNILLIIEVYKKMYIAGILNFLI